MKFKRSIVRSLIHVIALTFLLSPLSFSDEVGIDQKTITFWSDGSRLQGTIFTPKDIALEEKLPGILLIHGWGGHRGNLNKNYAPHFAKLGFVVMTFDLRSWGESDGFFVAETTLPPVNSVANVDVSGQHIRSIVNPFKMLDDARAALSWFVAEPNLQANNIGVWGTSFGGSLAVVTAANDRRVKALVTQMAPVNNQATFGQIPEGMVSAWETQRARGEITPYPGPESASPGLRGYPDMIAMKRYDPAAYWPKVSSPTLIIDAENEELFDRRVNGLALHQSLKGRIATNYKVIEGKHYDLYRGDGYEQALKAAQDWFLEHLK
ncbi:MAG: dipeptidyl aminopeptidase/acylaminoacyl peptidase [Neolewinella sp.]|jgi:dipeptidyl aminopeptidase/acylaminoacyl peptidase|tara:strand:- start:204 stop:1169 length:966 start_codon:yes stop_codon:yes gene_type:complete